jgi:hypothetical protein
LEVREDDAMAGDAYFATIENAIISGTLENFTTDEEGLIVFDLSTIPPWVDISLYAKYVD